MGSLREIAAKVDEYDRMSYLHERVRSLERRDRKRQVAAEAVIDAWRDGARRGHEGNPLEPLPPLPKDERRHGEQVAVLVNSDEQVGKLTGSYSTKVYAERNRRLYEKIIEIVRLHQHIHPVRRIHVHKGGDGCEGENIFSGQVHEIECPLTEQIVIHARETANLLRWLAHDLEVRWAAVPGNHGEIRTGGNVVYHRDTNADILSAVSAYELTKDVARIQAFGGTKKLPVNVNWYVIDPIKVGSHIWRAFLFHGHQVKGRLRVKQRVQDWAATMRFDSAEHGHFHDPALEFTKTGIPIFSNGTMESDNDYALRTLGAKSGPKQWLYFTNGRRLTASYLIDLDE